MTILVKSEKLQKLMNAQYQYRQKALLVYYTDIPPISIIIDVSPARKRRDYVPNTDNDDQTQKWLEKVRSHLSTN